MAGIGVKDKKLAVPGTRNHIMIGGELAVPSATTLGFHVVNCTGIHDSWVVEGTRAFEIARDYLYHKAEEINSRVSAIPKAPVLVHCHMGRNRSVAAVAMYLMVHRGMTLPAAYKRIRASRWSANTGSMNTFHNVLVRAEEVQRRAKLQARREAAAAAVRKKRAAERRAAGAKIRSY